MGGLWWAGTEQRGEDTTSSKTMVLRQKRVCVCVCVRVRVCVCVYVIEFSQTNLLRM